MSSPALPFVYFAGLAASVANVAWGMRVGRMHFGLGVLGASADRAGDPRGFWMYAICNGLAAAMCLDLLMYPR